MSRFIGKNADRLVANKHNWVSSYCEKKFSEVWEKENIGSRSVLSFLLEEFNLSDRDEMIAATVIQWLGSPFGQKFLREVQTAIDKKGCEMTPFADEISFPTAEDIKLFEYENSKQ